MYVSTCLLEMQLLNHSLPALLKPQSIAYYNENNNNRNINNNSNQLTSTISAQTYGGWEIE